MSEEKKAWTVEITDNVLEQMANDPKLAAAVADFQNKVKLAGEKFVAGEYASMEEAMFDMFPGVRPVDESELQDPELRDALLNPVRNSRH